MTGDHTIVHAVRSDSFSGVERYICDVTTVLHARGYRVAVVGGDPATMTRQLPVNVPHYAAASTAEVAAVLLRQRRAIVHCHMTAAEAAAAITKPVSRSRIVTTRHFTGRRGSTPAVRLATHALQRAVDRQIAISEFVAGSVEGRSIVLLNGVRDIDDGAPSPGKTVLVMQRHQPEKQTDIALRAWAASRLPEEGWRLTVLGRGSRTEDLKSLARQLDIDDSTDFLGFVPDPFHHMRQAGIFLATAPAEPFGLAVAEAMAHGLPVVAAAGGGHLETVGAAGLLFPPGDSAACAAALHRLASDGQLRLQLGRQARDRQRALFSLDAHVDRLEAIYASVAG